MDFYASELEKVGLEIVMRSSSSDGGLIIAKTPDESLSVNVTVSAENGEVKAMVNFNEK